MDRRFEIVVSGEMKDVLKKGEKEQISYRYEVEKRLVAPVEEGKSLGKISIYLGDKLLNIVNINAGYEIKRKTINEYLVEILKNKLNYVGLSN